MTRTEILRTAKRIGAELELDGWRFVIDARPTRRLGQTRYSQRVIGLSAKPCALLDPDQLDQVIRHECAHALVGPGYGHGPVWRAMARRCGVRRPKSSIAAPLVPGKVAIRCLKCGVVGTMHRMPKRPAGRVHAVCRYPVVFERKG